MRPHAPRAEAGAGPVGRARVVGGADDGHVVLAARAHVLDVGLLQERVDAGVVRQLAPAEGGDGPVDDRVGARQAHLQAPGDLPPPAVEGDEGLRLQRPPGLGPVPVVNCHLRLLLSRARPETEKPGRSM